MSQKYRIQKFSFSLVIANGTATITNSAVQLNGIIRGVMLNIPDLTGAGTFQLDILDADLSDATVASFSAVAENAKSSILKDANNNNLAIPVAGGYKLKGTASAGNQTGDQTITGELLIERG